MVSKFDEVGLVFLVAGGDEAVDLDCGFVRWVTRVEGWGEEGTDGQTSPLTLTFSSSL